MKHVFTANAMSADQEIVKQLLDEAKIPCLIKNAELSMALSELMPADCSPEVWILNDEDYIQAKQIVHALQNTKVENGVPWTCPDCGEAIEGQFTSCWNCGRDKLTT